MLSFSHIQLNVSDLARSVDFYISILGPFGFRVADVEEGQYARLTNDRDAVIVLSPVQEKYRNHAYHRKGVGLSHVAFGVESRQEVDRMAEILAAHGVRLLGEGKVDSDYRRGYYTLAFEDPDRIMIELVHHDACYFSASPP